MSRISCSGREVDLSYSTNVHSAETLDDLFGVLTEHVAPISRDAFGDGWSSVNLRLGIAQVNTLLPPIALEGPVSISDEMLAAPPSEQCDRLRDVLHQLQLRVVSINGFPILDFHATRVKEQVYAPPWTEKERAFHTVRIAKVLAHLMTDRSSSSVSVPTGVFKGDGDNDEIKSRCAHNIIEAAGDLARLERVTGKAVALALEPEPYTTGETLDELLDYFKRFILKEGAEQLPTKLGVSAAEAERLVRQFVTINLDLCHQAVEFEDPVEDLKRLAAAGVGVSGLHLSAALKLANPATNGAALEALLAMDEPTYLHQVVAKQRSGDCVRYPDLPILLEPDQAKAIEDFEELRCHFHVPLFAELPGPLLTTRDGVAPAARYAIEHDLTDNLVVETYTWDVLNKLAIEGSEAVQALVGKSGVQVNDGLAKELKWALAAVNEKSTSAP